MLAGLWTFSPALRGDWIWDDTHLITNNGLIHDPAGLWKIWFQPRSLLDYLPVKVSVEWLEWHFWHNDPRNYHLATLFLHLCGSLLVWRLFDQLGLKFAWLGGLIFAIHPVNVESVAWISELKNTLSLPPFLLAMCAYLRFDERGEAKDYFLALALFLVAMLCKVTMIMFPVIILLYAWWRHGRIRSLDLKASAAFFAVSLVLGLVTLSFVHRATDAYPIAMGGLFTRLARAGLSISFYFSKSFLPLNEMPLYPRWSVEPPSLFQFLPWPIIIGVIVVAWTKRTRWGRHALLGLGFFLINLLPFCGLTAGSYMSLTWVADHVLYIPIIGLIGLAVGALAPLTDRLPASFRLPGMGAVAVVIALLAWQSHSYSAVFVSEETLWSYAAERNPQAWGAYNNLGLALMAKGNFPGAIANDQRALQLYPSPDAANNLGLALMREGQLPQAMIQLRTALRLDPRSPVAPNNLGLALLQANRPAEAIAEYSEAVRLDPNYLIAHNNLGLALTKVGRISEAKSQFETALRLDPGSIDAHNNLGSLRLQNGEAAEAMIDFAAILRIDPDNAIARYNLGAALMQTGQNGKAIEEFERALRIAPDMADAHYSLGNALIQSDRFPEAIDQYETAIRLDPANADALANLGNALLQSGRAVEAVDQYQEALKMAPADIEVRKTLALVLTREGRVAEAKQQFEAILQIDPKNEDAQKALARIEYLEKNSQPAR